MTPVDGSSVIPRCLCGRDRARPWFRFGHFTILRCRDCRLIFTHPLPKGDEVGDLYTDRSFKPKTGAARRLKYAVLARMIAHFRRLPGPWLEVGCSQADIGRVLINNLGVPYLGIDLARAPLEYADSLGIPVRRGDLAELGFEDNELAVVVLSHVLEHVVDPKVFLDEVRRVLKPGGLLYAAVPDAGHWRTRILGRRWKYFGPPGHLWYFDRQTLSQTLIRSGFRVRGYWRSVFKTHLMMVAYKK